MKLKIEKYRGRPQGTHLWVAKDNDTTIMLASNQEHPLEVGVTYNIPVLKQSEEDQRYDRYYIDLEGEIEAYGIEVEEPKEGKVPKRKVTKKLVKKATKKKVKKKTVKQETLEDDPISEEDIEAMRKLEEAKPEEPEEIVISEEEINAMNETLNEIDEAEENGALVKVPNKELVISVDREAMIQRFEDYQFVMKNIVDENDWVIIGKKKFLRKSGFIKIATFFNVSAFIIKKENLSDPDRKFFKYEVDAKAIMPDGRAMEDSGMCDSREYNTPRKEHDIMATAVTRAKVRAISALMGMGEVSAEEVE